MVLSRHWQPRSVSPDGSAYSPQNAGPSTAESWQGPSKGPSAANAAVTDFGESGSISSSSSVWPESVARCVTRGRAAGGGGWGGRAGGGGGRRRFAGGGGGSGGAGETVRPGTHLWRAVWG